MRKWGENVWIRVVREGSVCVGGGESVGCQRDVYGE